MISTNNLEILGFSPSLETYRKLCNELGNGGNTTSYFSLLEIFTLPGGQGLTLVTLKEKIWQMENITLIGSRFFQEFSQLSSYQ